MHLSKLITVNSKLNAVKTPCKKSSLQPRFAECFPFDMAPAIKDVLQSFLDSTLDFVYPPLCICCGNLLSQGKDHVCPDCWTSLPHVHDVHPLFMETRRKLTASGKVDELVALYIFEKEGAFQSIAHALKYSGVQAVGLELGRRLGDVVRERNLLGEALVPVPLHNRKLRERGYNQSELIARGLSEVTKIPVRTDILRRTRYTETQTALSLEARKENMENAFTCATHVRKDLTILLVDDVITTGATIEACASAIGSSGPRKIIAVAAALAE